MNLMCSQNASKGWYYDGKHIGMDADSSTVFSDFYTARSQNLFRTHHRLDSLHPSSHGHRNDSTGGPVLSPCPRRLSSILPRCEIFADRTLENPGPSAGHGICAERNHPAGSRRHAVSSQRQKSRRGRFLARRCPLDQNENRLRLGPESCRSHFAGPTVLGWRTPRPADQHEAASQAGKNAHSTRRGNDRRNNFVVPFERISHRGRWILCLAGRYGSSQYNNHLANAPRCDALRTATEEKMLRQRPPAKTRQNPAQAGGSGLACPPMDESQIYRPRLQENTSGLFAASAVVQGQSFASASGHQPRPGGKRKRRLLFHDRCGYESLRCAGCLFRSMGNRGHLQTDQAKSWPASAANVGEKRSRTGCGNGSVAVFDGVAVVLQTGDGKKNDSEFCRGI